MKIRTLSLTLLLACAGTVWSQSATQATETSALRPLNLSVRKAQALDAVPVQPLQERQNRRRESTVDNRAAEMLDELPYGSGYDSRQRGNSYGAGMGSGSGSGNGGGRGRR